VQSAAFRAAPGSSPEDSELESAAGRLDLGQCLAACARSDRPDGLFTTVVADECGRALGLVYSSGESVAEAVRCGRGVYYSRSRGGLWRKGDTSGNFQELRSVRLDCDGDARVPAPARARARSRARRARGRAPLGGYSLRCTHSRRRGPARPGS
jgi:phosphoribosyl-AMP cyclohydrolase